MTWIKRLLARWVFSVVIETEEKGPTILIHSWGPMRSQWFELPLGAKPKDIQYRLTSVEYMTKDDVIVLRLENYFRHLQRNMIGCANCIVDGKIIYHPHGREL